MVIRDMFGELDDVKNETDEVFRYAGFIRPSESRCFPVSVDERKYIFKQFAARMAQNS